MKTAKIGAKAEPMTTPSIWLKNVPLKTKWVCFFLVMFRLGLWLKMRFIAISMVS